MDPHNRLDRDYVPCHWHAAPSGSGTGFRNPERGIELEAVETDALQRDLAGRWQLQIRERVNEAESCHAVGRVASESAALDALFRWMERINDAAERGESTVDVVALGREVVADASPRSGASTNRASRPDTARTRTTAGDRRRPRTNRRDTEGEGDERASRGSGSRERVRW